MDRSAWSWLFCGALSRRRLAGALGALLLVGSVPALAQSERPAARPRPERPERFGPRHGGRGPHSDESASRPSRLLPPWLDRLPGANPFRPTREDFGPLREGEEQELMAFAEEKLPNLHAALAPLRERDPRRFAQRMHEGVPRLRHMQRLFRESPALAEKIVAHSSELFQLQRTRGRLRHAQRAGNVPDEVAALQATLRDGMKRVHALEIEALELLTTQFETGHERWEQRILDHLASPRANLDDEPIALREAIEAYRVAPPPERAAANPRLRELLRSRMEEGLGDVRGRLRKLRESGESEIDDRVREFLDESRRPERRDRE